MVHVAFRTYSPFSENTYILYDESKECIIIDPGCYEKEEKEDLKKIISDNGLKPVRLINTHCHVDHVFGNRFVADTYNLKLEIHKGEIPVLKRAYPTARQYGLTMEESPEGSVFLEEGDKVVFGKDSRLKILLTPGHSPASICLYCEEDRFVIGGDVLFRMSIGRTDLPGGNHNTLMNSIMDKLMPLGDDIKVYPGHGPATTIGFEREYNPFIHEFMINSMM